MPSIPINLPASVNGQYTLLAAVPSKRIRVITLMLAVDGLVYIQFQSLSPAQVTTNLTGPIPFVTSSILDDQISILPGSLQLIIPERPLGWRGQQSWFDTGIGEALAVTLSNIDGVAPSVNIAGVLIYDTSVLSMS